MHILIAYQLNLPDKSDKHYNRMFTYYSQVEKLNLKSSIRWTAASEKSYS